MDSLDAPFRGGVPMKSASVVVVVLVTLGFGFSGLAQGQERRPAPSQDDTAKLEKRIAELERELATLRKELKDLRRELQAGEGHSHPCAILLGELGRQADPGSLQGEAGFPGRS